MKCGFGVGLWGRGRVWVFFVVDVVGVGSLNRYCWFGG